MFNNFVLNVSYLNKIGKGLGAGVRVERGRYRFSPAIHLCREAPCKSAVLKLSILQRLQQVAHVNVLYATYISGNAPGTAALSACFVHNLQRTRHCGGLYSSDVITPSLGKLYYFSLVV